MRQVRSSCQEGRGHRVIIVIEVKARKRRHQFRFFSCYDFLQFLLPPAYLSEAVVLNCAGSTLKPIIVLFLCLKASHTTVPLKSGFWMEIGGHILPAFSKEFKVQTV